MAMDAVESMTVEQGERRRSPWWLRAALWVSALALAAGAMAYQRATGPTYPIKSSFEVGGKSYRYELLRSSELAPRSEVDPTPKGADVELTLEGKPPEMSGTVHWRRFPTKDAFAPIAMKESIVRVVEKGGAPRQETIYHAELPPQPAAGKVEYYVSLDTPEGVKRLPPGERLVLLRYKDPVPDEVLVPHVTAMILVIVVGMRAALSALFDPATTRRYAWVALALMTVGGMMLGPLVQKYAFGEYWTGFPWGGDWTDNKMLVMWLAWLVACLALGASTSPVTKVGRAVTVAAAVVMTGVYLIPHSMGGSQLDYEAVDQGVDPKEAIRTGRGGGG